MLPEVKVRLSVEGTPEALAAFRSVQEQAAKTGKGAAAGMAPLGGSLSRIKGLLASVGSAVAVVAAARALGQFTAESVRAAREAGDTAKELGTTVEAYSALSVVAERAGKSPDKLNAGLGVLAQRIDALRAGEPSVTVAFRRIGLAKESFPGDDIAENADIVSRALMRFETSGTRSALATAVLGKQGRELITIFEKLIQMGGLEGAIGYARRTGKLIDESTVATLEALAESMRRLKMEAASAALQFMKGFGPEMVATLEALAVTLDGTSTPAFERAGAALGQYIRKAATWAQVVAESGSITADRTISATKTWSRVLQSVVAPTTIGLNIVQQGVDDALLQNRRDNAARWIAYLGDQYADETEKKLTQIKKEQDADDKKYRKDLAAAGANVAARERIEDAYLKRRNARIERETGLQVGAFQHQIEVLAWGAPDARARKVIAGATAGITQLEKEKPDRLAEPPPDAYATPGAPDAKVAAERETKAGEARLKAQQAEFDRLEAAAKANYEVARISLDEYYAERLRIIDLRASAELDLLTAKWAEAQQIKDPKVRQDTLGVISAQTDEVTTRADTERAQAAEDYGDKRKKLELALAAISADRMEAEGREHELRIQRINEEMLAYADLLIQAGMTPMDATVKAGVNAGKATALEDFRVQLEQAQADLDAVKSLGNITPEDIARLNAVADALERVSVALGPKAVKGAKAVGDGIREVVVQEKQLNETGQTFANALGTWMSSSINQVNSLSDAFRSLGMAILQVIQQMLAAKIASQLLSFIPGMTTAAPAPAPVAKATGGLMYGPGTGTSDSIPTLLSRGEYVVRASSVAQPGVLAALDRINQGSFSAPLRLYGGDAREYARMAVGGLVSARPIASSRAAGVNLSGGATIELAEGLIARHVDAYMQSVNGQRTQIRVISKNRRAIGSALR